MDEALAKFDALATLLRAARHPLRLRILAVLHDDKPTSPSRLTKRYNLKLGDVSYHITQLRKAGLVELVDKREVRGTLEHFYGLTDEGRRLAEFLGLSASEPGEACNGG